MSKSTRDDLDARTRHMADLLEEFRSRREQQVRQMAKVDAALAEARALVDLARQQAKHARERQIATTHKSRRPRTKR
jgi:hypothetical protein